MEENTSVRQLFSYDKEEHADIHNFLESLPSRKKSKYIRVALRLLMKSQSEEESIASSDLLTNSVEQKSTTTTLPKKEESDDYINAGDDLLNIGK